MILRLLISALLTALAASMASAATVSSPDGAIVFDLRLEEGRLVYGVRHGDRTVLEDSALGFELQGRPSMAAAFDFGAIRHRESTENFELPWGETRFVRDAFREMQVELEHDGGLVVLTVRVFDDGFGFRFEWPEQEGLEEFVILDELTEFRLPGDPVLWWIPAYAGNRYENVYQRSRLSEIRSRPDIKAVHTPLTIETEDGLYLSIHEAALTDYASMTLEPQDDGSLQCDLVPWSDGTKVEARAPFRSPWRTMLIATRPGDLVESTLILSLNEPSRIADTSWIRPMKYVGIWWSLHIGKETWHPGPAHGATTENTLRMLDFAADHGFGGVLIEGWNTGWGKDWGGSAVFDFTTPTPDYDLDLLAEHARQRGVTLIGHLETGGDVHGFERHLEAALGQCQRLGIRAVKTGYVSHGQSIRRYDDDGNVISKEWQHGQFMVRHYRKVVEAAARHGVMVNVHEPIKDTGIRRTWPNMLTREGARGQEYNAWSEGNGVEHTVVLPFTRLLSGPMDFTPGIFNVTIEPYRESNRVPTTLAKQLALYVTIFSPLQMVTDLPEHYDAHPAFGFIKAVPTDWGETRVIHAAIGDYVTIARKQRGGDEWFLGSITDGSPRKLRVPLEFLDRGTDYVATIYADAAGSDVWNRPTQVSIKRKAVDATTVLELELAAGGGQAIRVRPRSD